jgi:hypothetical protein
VVTILRLGRDASAVGIAVGGLDARVRPGDAIVFPGIREEPKKKTHFDQFRQI